MKKIIIASALVFGTLCACQKNSELDDLVSSKPNSSRSPKDDDAYKQENFDATLVAIKGEKNSDDNDNLFKEFPEAEEIYEYNFNSKVRLNFLSVSSSFNFHEPVRAFSVRIVQEPITILDAIRKKYSVCFLNTEPQIECISSKEMQKVVYYAFINAGYNIKSVTVSVNGDIVVTFRNPDSTLASCIATVISYFN